MSENRRFARNYCFDFCKGIACLLVVFMHCEFPGKLGILVQCVSRFCVPFFFMISGYYCYRKDVHSGNQAGMLNDKRISYISKIRHIASITIVAIVFYIVVTPLYNSDAADVSLESLLHLLVFNEPFYIAGQLWFLFALLYDYLLFAMVEKLKIRNAAYIAIPVGIIVYIATAQGAYLMGHSFPNMYYRNFLIEGFPLFLLGSCVHEYQDKIKFSNKVLLVLLAVSTVLSPMERMILGRDFGVNIVSFIQVAALFLLGINNPGLGEGTLLNKLGKKYSMYVYIIHPAVWHLLDKIYSLGNIDSNELALYLRPVMCVLITILISIIYVNVKYEVIDKQSKKV